MVNLVPLFSETPFLVNKVELAVQWNNLRGFLYSKKSIVFYLNKHFFNGLN